MLSELIGENCYRRKPLRQLSTTNQFLLFFQQAVGSQNSQSPVPQDQRSVTIRVAGAIGILATVTAIIFPDILNSYIGCNIQYDIRDFVFTFTT